MWHLTSSSIRNSGGSCKKSIKGWWTFASIDEGALSGDLPVRVRQTMHKSFPVLLLLSTRGSSTDLIMILDQFKGVVTKKPNRTQDTRSPCVAEKILANFVHRNVRKLLQSIFAETGSADAIITNYMNKTDSNKGNLYIELTGTMWIFEIAWCSENSLCHWRVN